MNALNPQVKERPILFSAPMVLALLAGTKTQTRRIVKPMKRGVLGKEWRPFDPNRADDRISMCDFGPFGTPGDRLWVREASIIAPPRWGHAVTENFVVDRDGERRLIQYLASQPDREAANGYKLKATPSIHMPRWASRITLEVTGVRVERLQEISDEDAIAEGCTGFDPEPVAEGGTIYFRPGISSAPSPRAHFRVLWESINGADSWKANPWVWVVAFKRIEVEVAGG